MGGTPGRAAPVLAAPRLAGACVLAAAVVAVVVLALGPSLVVLAPWDIVIDLDEAWRLHLGQRPNLDFHTPVGPLRFVLIAAGMGVVGPRLQAVVVGDVIFLGVAVLLAVFVAFRRLGGRAAVATVAVVILMSVAARGIGRGPDTPGYVEYYNRFGWVLVSLLYLQLFVPRRPELRRLPALEGAVIGAVIAALAYTKITYGIVALAGLGVAMWRHRELRDRRVLVAGVVAAVLVAVVMWASVGVSPSAYLRDVADAVRSQLPSRRLGSVRSTLRNGSVFVLLLLVAWVALVGLPARRRQLPRRRAVETTVVALFIAASAAVLAFWNTGESGEIPLLTVVGVWLLADHAGWSRQTPGTPTSRRRLAVATVAVVVVAAWTAVQDAASLVGTATGREYRTAAAPSSQRFDAAPLHDYVIPADANWETEIWRSEELPVRVDDGLALVRAHSGPDDTVLTLGFSNVFPYALGTRPPRGVPVFLDVNNNLSAGHHPAPDQLFADVDLVAVPVVRPEALPQGGADAIAALLQMYGPYLDAEYAEVGRSENWVLLRRRGT